MNPQRSSRKTWLWAVFGSLAVVVVVCGAALILVPWRYWYDRPETALLDCELADNAMVAEVEVTNWSFSDRTYAVTVTVRNLAGTTVGSQESKVEVPSRHSRRTRLVVIATPDADNCEITKAKTV